MERMRFLPLLALAGLIALPCAARTAVDEDEHHRGHNHAAVPIELSFADFFVRPIGPKGLVPTPQLTAANGSQVRVVGFMVRREQPQPGRFLLTPRPVSMAEHADGEADDLPASTLTVVLAEPQRGHVVAHQSGALALTGRLEYGPAEDETGRVSWLRLYLTPDALETRPAAATAHSAHSH